MAAWGPIDPEIRFRYRRKLRGQVPHPGDQGGGLRPAGEDRGGAPGGPEMVRSMPDRGPIRCPFGPSRRDGGEFLHPPDERETASRAA
ncbi:hypothetical protein [Roseomonas chloroacetimidivorans]|uniref:hypothetical protein n=1 Tax=Roseomonas chloroacetimidivorans TaxID=1766656 RepID=UPI003C783775